MGTESQGWDGQNYPRDLETMDEAFIPTYGPSKAEMESEEAEFQLSLEAKKAELKAQGLDPEEIHKELDELIAIHNSRRSSEEV